MSIIKNTLTAKNCFRIVYIIKFVITSKQCLQYTTLKIKIKLCTYYLFSYTETGNNNIYSIILGSINNNINEFIDSLVFNKVL